MTASIPQVPELWLERIIKEFQGKSPYANGRADQAKATLKKLHGEEPAPDA